jgi:predicted metalloprotease with PDZ domain
MFKIFTVFIYIIINLNGLIYGYSSVNENYTKSKSQNTFDISYSIEPFYDINVFRFIVVLEFKGDKSGETIIQLPGEFGGQQNLYGIKFLKTLSESTTLHETENPEQKIVKYPPSSHVKIYYQVEESRDDDLELGNHYMVVLNRKFFHFLGETFFIIPKLDWNSEFRIRLLWNHMPSIWNLANSFGINEKVQDLKLPLWKFKYSVFTGGDFRIHRRIINNNPIYLSIRGKWNFNDDQLMDVVRDIIRIERDFWNDHNFPFFLLTILPIEGSGDQGGTGRTNSYALFLSNDRTIDYRMKKIIAHEAFHTWLGGKIQFAEPEQLVYWFKEGFCDYYSRLLLLRAKLISLSEYVEEYNKILYSYYTSSVRFEKNERVVKEFWVDQNIMKLPYMRGDIIAHNLNAFIKLNSNGTKSLDDFMHDLMRRCQNESLVISNGSLSAMIRFYTGEQMLSDIMRALNSGVILKSHPNAAGPCFKMRTDSFKKFWLIGELFEVPVYESKSELTQPAEKKCLEWFGIN